MLTNAKKKVGLIHVARKQCGLSDARYRDILIATAGVESSREIEYEDQFQAVMAAFEALGFKSFRAQGFTSSRPDWSGRWACSDGKRAKIEAMWRTVARNKSDKALQFFVRRIAKVDHPAFLLDHLAQKVIVALSAMMEAAGYDPTTGGRSSA